LASSKLIRQNITRNLDVMNPLLLQSERLYPLLNMNW